MFARFDLSALSRRRSAKFVLALLSTVVVIALVAFTARAWRHKTRFTAKQNNVTAQPKPSPNTNDYIRRSRLPSKMREALSLLGDRWEKPGKERLSLNGTLRRQGDPRTAPFRLFTELPNRMRLEEQVGGQWRVIGFDGNSGWALNSTFGDSDQEMIETLVFDSMDHFLFEQTQGLATRFLGSRFRTDDGATANYRGPFYDVYQVNDRIISGSTVREQSKLFHLNSDTLLLERIQYRISRAGAPVNIEVRIGGWRKIDNQQAPGTITRLENGVPALTLNIVSAAVGPRVADGIFNKPTGQNSIAHVGANKY